MSDKGTALIIGAGEGISASFARRLAASGYRVALAARDSAKLAALCSETGATAHAVDAADHASVERLFSAIDATMPPLSVLHYNPSFRVRGPIVELAPEDVARSLAVTAFGGFLAGQQAARRMLARGSGTILFTGASASVKGYAQSAPFAMGKFALRGLAQAMARELQPKGIHVAHVVIDGGVRSHRRPADPARPDALLDPDAIAETMMAVLSQPRSAWSLEVELRPWLEPF